MNLFRRLVLPRWLWTVLAVLLALTLIKPPAPGDPVRILLWDYTWPLRPDGEETYGQWLEQTVASFREANPGVEVEFRLIPWGLGPAQLAEAWLGRGGPDLYSGPLETLPVGLDGLAPFRPEVLPGSLLSWAAAPVTSGRQVMALPRWGWLEALAGDPVALKAAGIEAEAVATQGWTYEEFAEAIKKIGQTRNLGRKVWGLTTDHDGRLLHGLVAAAGFPRIFDPSGLPAWPVQAVKSVTGSIGPLVSDGSVALASPGRESMLELYLARRTGLVGPVGPWILQVMEERKARGRGDARETLLLPFPGPSREKSRPLMSLSVLAVRRDPSDRGGRKSQAAAQLARHLAANSEGVARRLGAVWAYQGSDPDRLNLAALPAKALIIPAQTGIPGGPGLLINRKDLAGAAGLLLKGKIEPEAFLSLVAPNR